MKKIMFNDKYGLTKAVLEGRKTQTRRIAHLPEGATVLRPDLVKLSTGELRRPFIFGNYKRNEEVAVAQSYHDAKKEVGGLKGLLEGHPLPSSKGINNKMFVKADLMPHRIKITNIRVERLQDISEEDCLKEGVIEHKNMTPEKDSKIWYYYTCRGIGVQRDKYFEDTMFRTARDAYAALIDKTCGKGTWESNPWVFVYDFELIK